MRMSRRLVIYAAGGNKKLSKNASTFTPGFNVQRSGGLSLKDYAIIFDAVHGSNTGISGTATAYGVSTSLTKVSTGISMNPGKVYAEGGCAVINAGKQSNQLIGMIHGSFSQAYHYSNYGYAFTNSLTKTDLGRYGADRDVKAGSLPSYTVFGGGYNRNGDYGDYRSYLYVYNSSFTRIPITTSSYDVVEDNVYGIITVPSSHVVILKNATDSSGTYTNQIRTLNNSLTRSGISTITTTGRIINFTAYTLNHGVFSTFYRASSGTVGINGLYSVNSSNTFAQLSALSPIRTAPICGSVGGNAVFAGGTIYTGVRNNTVGSTDIEYINKSLVKTTLPSLSYEVNDTTSYPGRLVVVSNSKYALIPKEGLTENWDVYKLG